jgi:non-specific protein-tyrosine kinase
MVLQPEAAVSRASDGGGTDPLATPGAALRLSDRTRALALEAPRARLSSGMAELFRRIYTRARVRNSVVLAVCSAIAGEGKTTISLGMAQTFAQDFPERRVLVVETDVEGPTLASNLDLDPNPGLIDCLLEGHPIQAGYRATCLENLDLLPAGGPTDFPGRVLRSSRMASAIDAMCQTHDLVILDVPAILMNSDALLLTELVEGVIFVVRAGVTPLDRVRKAIAELDEGKLRGVVLNGATTAIPDWLRRLSGL